MTFSTDMQGQASSSELPPSTQKSVGITKTFSGNLPCCGTDWGWGGRAGQRKDGDAKGHAATEEKKSEAGNPI